MIEDFYCDEVFSGKMKVNKVLEIDNVLVYYYIKFFYLVYIVVVFKKYIFLLIILEEYDYDLFFELMGVI